MIKEAEYHLHRQMTLVCDHHRKQAALDKKKLSIGYITIVRVRLMLRPVALNYNTLLCSYTENHSPLFYGIFALIAKISSKSSWR